MCYSVTNINWKSSLLNSFESVSYIVIIPIYIDLNGPEIQN